MWCSRTRRRATAAAWGAPVEVDERWIELDYGDLMVHQAEYRSSCATVVLLDISHSSGLTLVDAETGKQYLDLTDSNLVLTHSTFPDITGNELVHYLGFPLRGYRWASLLHGTGVRISTRDSTTRPVV